MNKNWYVLYTKPRNEKKAIEQLTALGIEVYCPLKTEIKQWTDRKKKVQTPLFTSYCFVRIEESQRYRVFEARAISRFVTWLGKPAIVKETEIDEIKRWLNDFSHDKIKAESFQKGQSVTIQSGPLMHQEAIVTTQKGKQLVLQLPHIGFQLIVSLDEVEVVLSH